MSSNFTDVLGLKRTAAKFIPKLLNFQQKRRRLDITQELSTAFNDDPWFMAKNHGFMAMILKPKPKHPKIEKITSSSAKCGGFTHYFLRLQCCCAL